MTRFEKWIAAGGLVVAVVAGGVSLASYRQ